MDDDNQSIEALVRLASGGDSDAWDEIVERYGALVVAVCRRFRLNEADMYDVSQTVWLRLVEHLPALREPRALPGWLVTTAKRECLRVVGLSTRQVFLDEPNDLTAYGEDLDAELLAAERRSALREALAVLPPAWRELVALLVADPPIAYVEISRRLGIPVGSIGPTRARCIERIRSVGAVAGLLHGEQDQAQPESRTARTATRRR
jgi:RNA polymerase sigma factor (sigma-70 family)